MLIFNKKRVFYRSSLGLLMIFMLQHTNVAQATSAVKHLLVSATGTNDFQSDTSWKRQSPAVISNQTPLPFFVVLDAVLTNHPVLKQSQNYQPIAEAELSIAKGAFDPMISYYRNNKNEGSKLYQNQNLDVYIPNYFGGGISINNPYSVNSGTASGSLGLEIDFPLLKGLITDYRRTYLAKSKINVKMSIAQRDQWVNDLVQDVFLQYSQWLFAHETAVQIEQVLKIAEERQNGLRKLFTSGAGTAVDTMETHVQLQQYRAKFDAALWKKEKQRLMISMFLWDENGKPIEPLNTAMPTQDGLMWIDSLVMEATKFFDTSGATANGDGIIQPAVRLSLLKLESQQLEFRLAKNLMLPSLNLKYGYSQPNADWRFTPSGATQFTGFGLGFQSGLFLRQQRGQYRQMQLTVKNASLEVNNKMRSYQVKSNALFQEYSVNKDQWLQWKQIGENQLLLYRMEAKRLEAGDVNFFILNTREMRLLDLNLTALEYKYQYQASGVAYLHYLGWLR
ncbi:MAG: hypothetical protein RLZZ512_346 [Bacteroidota bacterium]|jgi:outer membrane protein TolC